MPDGSFFRDGNLGNGCFSQGSLPVNELMTGICSATL
jgi:hypothetical protein